jgi:hypothetical protein
MPVSYTIDEAAGVVRVECSGVLTSREMLDCIEHVFSDPARKPGMAILVDWRAVQSMEVTHQGMQAAATIKATLIDPEQRPWTLAFVAPQDEMFWAARTYEVLRAGSPETVRVFRDAAEAEEWVLRQASLS